jgi:hypothetical protein
MSTHPMPAKRILKAGVIMSALWLGVATMLVWQAQGNEKVSTKVPAPSDQSLSFLEIISNAHLDNLPIQ